jgi:signal transduction histidine kinase
MYLRVPILFLLLTLPFLSPAQNGEIDSLKKVLASSASDTLKLMAYSDLNWLYSQNDYELSKKYAMDELALAQKINNTKWIAQAYNDMAISYYRLNQVESALVYNYKALAIRKDLKDQKLIASSLSKIGVLQIETGEYAAALKSQFETLKIFESVNDQRSTAITLNNISQTFHKLKNYDKEIEYGEKAIAIDLKNNFEYNLAECYGNLGAAYKMKKQISLSNDYLQKALAIFHKYGDKANEASVLNSMGLNYKLELNHKMAYEYYKKAYDLAMEAGDRSGVAIYGHNISCSLTDFGKYAEAEKHSLEVLKMTETKNRNQLILTYRQLATIYGYMNEGEKARFWLNKFSDLKDTLFTRESAAAVAEMEVKYLSEKKDLELAKNKADLEAKDRQNFIKNMIIVSILVVMILLSLLVFSIYKRRQIKQKADVAAELARQKEIRSIAVIEAEEKERRRIAQDLHDGVGQILSAAKLNLSGLESKLKLQDPEQSALLYNSLDLVNDSIKEVRVVSHNMMPNILIKLGLASAIREFISKMGAVANLRIDLEIIGLDERLDSTVETILYRVIQEAVSNIIKHAKANHISLQLIRHDRELTVMIEDNGVGFDRSAEFEGIGLKNITSRVEFLNGHVDFDTTPGQGTTVVIEVPLV